MKQNNDSGVVYMAIRNLLMYRMRTGEVMNDLLIHAVMRGEKLIIKLMLWEILFVSLALLYAAILPFFVAEYPFVLLALIFLFTVAFFLTGWFETKARTALGEWEKFTQVFGVRTDSEITKLQGDYVHILFYVRRAPGDYDAKGVAEVVFNSGNHKYPLFDIAHEMAIKVEHQADHPLRDNPVDAIP